MPIPLPIATVDAGALDPAQLAALAAVGFLGWRLLAIWIFPYAPCRHCRGTGKHRSGQCWRPCPRCQGTGRRIRLGRRIWDWTRNTDTTRR